MNIFLLIMVIPYLIFVIFILSTVLLTVARGVKACRNIVSTCILHFAEVVFTIIGPIIGFMRFDQYGPDIPFSKQYVLVVILFVITSSAAFWLARFTSKTGIATVRIITSVGLLQGILLCAITSVHFIPYLLNGLMFPTMGFELLSPVIAFALLSREFYFYNKMEFNLNELLPYRQELGFIPIPLKIFQLPIFQRCLVYGALLVPAIVVEVLLAYGCGQDIDALVKAFTHSHGFTFSIHN